MRTKTLDNSTFASHPGQFNVSRAKLWRLQPELKSLFAWWWFLMNSDDEIYPRRAYWLTHIEEHLLYGDTKPAVVVSTSPLLVAAHSDELDCVALLRFNKSLVKDHGLNVGSRLLTVNTYFSLDDGYERDLQPGVNAIGRWGNFAPFIAEFLSDDLDSIHQHKVGISESDWQMVEQLGAEYLINNRGLARDGRPLLCANPATRESEEAEQSISSISRFDVLKRVLMLLAFLGLSVLSLIALRSDKNASWLAIIVFGSMSVLAAFNVFQVRKLKIVKGESAPKNFRKTSIWIGTLVVTIVIGLSGEFISRSVAWSWPKLGIWVACFLSTLALYPFRDKQEKGLNSFPIWTLYSCLMGLVSIGISDFLG